MSGTKMYNILPTELIKQLEEMGDAVGGIVDDMLDAGVGAVKPTVEKNLDNAERGNYGTGPEQKTIAKSLVVRKAKTKAIGMRVITFKGTSNTRSARRGGKVYKRAKPVRIAEIAAILEYGKSDQPPRPFMRTAFAAKQAEISAAMEKKFDEKTKKYQN